MNPAHKCALYYEKRCDIINKIISFRRGWAYLERQSEVLLNIKGTRELMGEDDTIMFTVAGLLTSGGDKYTLRYADERSEGAETEIVVENGAVSMTRTGEDSTEMFFRRNTPYSSFYNTPFGKLDMTVLPTMVQADMGTEKGKIELEYIMNIAGSQIVNKLQLSYKKDGSNAGKENFNENRMDGSLLL